MSKPQPRNDVETVLLDPKSFDVPGPDELRELRILAGLTLREASEEIGVNKDTIWRWEQKERSPRLCDVKKALEVYRSQFDGQYRFSD